MPMDRSAVAEAIRQASSGFGPHISWMNKPVPPVATIMAQMFNLAQSVWAREFLFFPNPHVDAGILTSALNLQHKVAGQIKLDIKAARIGPYASNAHFDRSSPEARNDDQLYCDWVIIPAFNFGQQGACYFVQKTDSGTGQDHNGAARSALYRIVTDDVTGEVLYVADMPETDTYQVVHMTHLNGAYHERSIAFFEGSVFRAALTADNGRMSIPHIVKALTMCVHTREVRNCKTCGAHPAMLCNCTVSVRQSEHPHDLRFYAHNTRAHLGYFNGKENVFFLQKGLVVATKSQHCLHRTDENATNDTAKSLWQWAVTTRLGALIQRAFGKYVQRSPISTAALAYAVMNLENKSFDEFVDDLADSENPSVIGFHHYTRKARAISNFSSSSDASSPLWQHSSSKSNMNNGEVDISSPVMANFGATDPLAVSGVSGGIVNGITADVRSVHIMQQRKAVEEQQLAEQLAAEQHRMEVERRLADLRVMHRQRALLRERQLAEQRELLLQRQVVEQQRQLVVERQRQYSLGHQQIGLARPSQAVMEQLAQEENNIMRRSEVLAAQQNQEAARHEMMEQQLKLAQQESNELQNRACRQQTVFAQQKRAEQHRLIQEQKLALQEQMAQQQRSLQQEKMLAQQHDIAEEQGRLYRQALEVQNVNCAPGMAAASVLPRVDTTICGAGMQSVNVGGGGSFCRTIGGQKYISAGGNKPVDGGHSDSGSPREVCNVSNDDGRVWQRKRGQSSGALVGNTGYVPHVPCALSVEQIGAPVPISSHAAGAVAPSVNGIAAFGAAVYARSGAFRTELGSTTVPKPSLGTGWQQHSGGSVMGALDMSGQQGVSLGRGPPPSGGILTNVRPATTQRRLLPRGAQPGPAQAEDPKAKRELDVRIRKREAARRSDARRAAKVQYLHSKTIELERIMDNLREKEGTLRIENAELKERVAALGSNE